MNEVVQLWQGRKMTGRISSVKDGLTTTVAHNIQNTIAGIMFMKKR